VVGIAWIGFDQPRKLGSQETGGVAALPIWIGYMQRALKGVPESQMPPPEGVINVGGEWYFREFGPGENAVQSLGLSDGTAEGEKKADEIRNQLF
jgi:penicillin-binding protein 1A